jgi:hypothetical protein
VIGLIIPTFLKRQKIFFDGLVSIIEERMKDVNSARKHVSCGPVRSGHLDTLLAYGGLSRTT